MWLICSGSRPHGPAGSGSEGPSCPCPSLSPFCCRGSGRPRSWHFSASLCLSTRLTHRSAMFDYHRKARSNLQVPLGTGSSGRWKRHGPSSRESVANADNGLLIGSVHICAGSSQQGRLFKYLHWPAEALKLLFHEQPRLVNIDCRLCHAGGGSIAKVWLRDGIVQAPFWSRQVDQSR